MAPLWKAMLSKSSPLYRDALFSFSLWEWKAQERELLLLRKLSERERRALLAQLDKLSKELQQKDKIIESLRSKLSVQPQRSDTPCSSHALSDTTDQSDRISYVSDEHGSAQEDLDLCSDLEAASELGQKDTRSSTRASTGFSTPQSKPAPGFPFGPQQPDPAAFLPLSFGGYPASPFSGGLDAMKAGGGLLESSALWDMSYGARPVRLGADLSSGSSGYQSGTSNTGSDLMKEHLREIRSLRQRLEDSIQTNDRLRQQLEERLARTATEKGAPTNIYIQGLDSVGQLSGEIRLLKEENLSLQQQLKQAAREGSREVERLREAELEAERWAEQSRKLEAEAEARSTEISHLRQERLKNQEAVNRLQHEVSVLQQQLSESRSLLQALQAELQLHQQLHQHTTAGQDTDGDMLTRSAATFDPRELHLQLEQQLSAQTGTPPPRRRRQPLNENVPSPPVRDTGLVSPPSPQQGHGSADQAAPALQGQAPDGSFANRHGRHTVGHVDDFKALQQQLLQGAALLRRMEAELCSLSAAQEVSQQPSDPPGAVRKLLLDGKSLRQVLQEAESLLRMFWRAALPDQDPQERAVNAPQNQDPQERAVNAPQNQDPQERAVNAPQNQDTQEECLREEVLSLRLRLSEQEEALKEATESLRSSNRTKDSMEHFIVSQLSRTRDVLRKAKTNLQERLSHLQRTQRH